MSRVAFETFSSAITGRKVPEVKSLSEEAAALRRNIDFGVKITIGRRVGFAICQRNKWKYDAGLEG